MAAEQQHDPLAQFEIKTIVPMQIGGVDLSFTNSSLFMVLALIAVTAFLTLSMRGQALVPGRWQVLAEMFYGLVAGMVRENVGAEGRKYFPFIFSLFMFILFGNLRGLLPYTFTFTSHLVVTFAMAAVVFIGVTIIAIAKHRLRFLGFFLPTGVPLIMAPLIVPIEILSYFIRPVSLSLRLFANMTAGHTMLKVFAGFIATMGVFGIFPLGVVIALTGLEILVACLQAYVFTVLSCIYLHDALHLH